MKIKKQPVWITSILVVLILNRGLQTENEYCQFIIHQGMLIITLNIKSNPKSKAPAAQ